MPGPVLAGKATLDDSQFQASLRKMGQSAGAVSAQAAAQFKKIGEALDKSGALAAGRFKGALGSLASPLAAIGPAIAAAFASKAIISGVANVFEAGRALQQMSRATGASVAGLAILQAKFKQAGLDGDAVASSIFRLQKSINGVEDEENKGGPKALASLRLNLQALSKANPAAQLFAVGRAIGAISDPAARTATAMQIFGKSWRPTRRGLRHEGFCERPGGACRQGANDGAQRRALRASFHQAGEGRDDYQRVLCGRG
jgi:hypothetical protein